MEGAWSREKLHFEEIDVEHNDFRIIVIVRVIGRGLSIEVMGEAGVFDFFVVLVGQSESEASYILVVWLYGETDQLVLLFASVEETRVKYGLFLAHCVEIAFPSFFQLNDVLYSTFSEVLEKGVVFSGFELEFIEVVVFIVWYIRSSFQLILSIDCPLL